MCRIIRGYQLRVAASSACACPRARTESQKSSQIQFRVVKGPFWKKGAGQVHLIPVGASSMRSPLGVPPVARGGVMCVGMQPVSLRCQRAARVHSRPRRTAAAAAAAAATAAARGQAYDVVHLGNLCVDVCLPPVEVRACVRVASSAPREGATPREGRQPAARAHARAPHPTPRPPHAPPAAISSDCHNHSREPGTPASCGPRGRLGGAACTLQGSARARQRLRAARTCARQGEDTTATGGSVAAWRVETYVRTYVRTHAPAPLQKG